MESRDDSAGEANKHSDVLGRADLILGIEMVMEMETWDWFWARL